MLKLGYCLFLSQRIKLILIYQKWNVFFDTKNSFLWASNKVKRYVMAFKDFFLTLKFVVLMYFASLESD